MGQNESSRTRPRSAGTGGDRARPGSQVGAGTDRGAPHATVMVLRWYSPLVKRYETDVRDGVLFLEADAAWVPDEEAGPTGDGEASPAGSDEASSAGSHEASPTDEDEASPTASDEATNDESDVQWVEIGPVDDLVDLIGGEEYVLEYDERQRAAGWLDTDEDGRLTFDVRETIRTTDFNDEFVEAIAGAPADETTEEGHPKRAVTFADLLTTIWDAKGDL